MKDITKKKQISVIGLLETYGSLAAFVVMIIVFSCLSPFFRVGNNYMNIIVQSAPLLIIALGATFVNMAGESDLSLGGTVGLAASLFCGTIQGGMNPWVSFIIAMGVCVLFGLLNGALVAYAGLSSFVVTISVMFLTMGIEMAYSGGSSLWIRDNPVLGIVNNMVGPVPLLVIIALAIFLIVYLFLHRTRIGVHVQAVGLSADAARFAGIPVKPIKLSMFMLGSVFYGIGGILNALRSSGAIIYSGQKILLPALAITYIAKTILGMKKPNVPGILIGALMLASISNAFTLMGIEFYYTLVVQGGVLLGAAALSAGNRNTILQEDLR